MMTEIQTIEGGWKDVSSLEGTKLKKIMKVIYVFSIKHHFTQRKFVLEPMSGPELLP